ncbi:hypothetical protein LPJ66_007274 [Kickxella alabastrina]|uniref:Uncharacterized protein n=1 Tax=Kickxella alabastrina TaxID=61397 RepID=A0ACC1I9K5_9FUNG|nr:hypothetical protein LPJ66_007274 [Kickxella alabastrina]
MSSIDNTYFGPIDIFLPISADKEVLQRSNGTRLKNDMITQSLSLCYPMPVIVNPQGWLTTGISPLPTQASDSAPTIDKQPATPESTPLVDTPDPGSPSLPILDYIFPSKDISAYFSEKRSMLYCKKTKMLKTKAPNAYMLFRLDHIKSVKGQGYSATNINEVISRAWAKLSLSKKTHYTELSRGLQQKLSTLHRQTPSLSKPKKFKSPTKAVKKDEANYVDVEVVPDNQKWVDVVDCRGFIEKILIFTDYYNQEHTPVHYIKYESAEIDCGIQYPELL